MQWDAHEGLRVDVQDGVASVTIDRPHARNAMTTDMMRSLKDVFRSLDRDAEVDIVLLTGSGSAFSAGGDLKEVLSYLRGDQPNDIYRFEDSLPFATIESCSKTVVSLVNGPAMAGGFLLALASDIVLVDEHAYFSITEGLVGLAEEMIPSMLAGSASLMKIKYYALTAQPIPADEAAAMGFVTEVVPHGKLDERAREVVLELRATSPRSRRLYKEYVNNLKTRRGASSMYAALLSPEARARLEGFASRPDVGGA